ncbi:hypothetical protein SB6415_00039 [Klebsiella pasteurii]|uniref:hypothetical protein n=1 Tax=Klebsiella pasteurii TaxID=2587529 RepID=UPI001159D64D|nr:hypothetical protein [Klebsiella pasteurii]VUS55743.1 hypothetical protein SB6415_00039 [Klebsiella pasteurii]
MNIKDATNLIVNGTFDSNDLHGWDAAGTTASPDAFSGHASLPMGASISQTVDITGGGTYALSYYMGLLYEATGEITVVANPSGNQLFMDSAAGTQSSISLTVIEPTDTTLTIKFQCQVGGELDVDNVSLVAVATEQAVVVGGDFSDNTLPGWVKTGNSSGTMPSATDGYLKLPAGTTVYQDIVVEEDKQLEIACSMTLPDGAAGTFSVTSRPSYSSSTTASLYTSSTALSGQPVYCFPPEGDTIVRLTYACSSGEMDVDDVAMGYASSTLISEVQTGDHAPWIAPGTSGSVTFSIADNAPADAGSRIHFTAPTGTTLVNASIPDLASSYYTFTLSDDSLTGNLTLTKDIGTWGSCDLTLAVAGDTAAGASLDDGVVKYFTSDSRQMGDNAAISVIAATVTITEQQTDGHTPWIFPGTSGTVTFSVVADAPDGTGSYLYFTAPTYTDPTTQTTSHNATITGVTLSDSALEGKYTFTTENSGLNARVTLVTDDVSWSDCIVTLAVDSSMPKFATLDNGKVQYIRSDGQQVGDTAGITLIAASSNHWDNVKSVESCLIGMQSDDTTYVANGSLFMNGNTLDHSISNSFVAHSIPVFVGITFKRFSDDFDGPTDDEVHAALSLVGLGSDGQTIIDISSDLNLYADPKYLNAYYKQTTLLTDHKLSLKAGGYDHELIFSAGCPRHYNEALPGDIVVYLHLDAPLSTGTYLYTSNGETLANLTINFLAMKKYQYSEDAGSSSYILVKKETASDFLQFDSSGEVRKVGATDEKSLYRISIDSTPEQSKYIFKFSKFFWMNFTYPVPATNYDSYGYYIDSAFIQGFSIGGKPQWTNYGQHIFFPGDAVNYDSLAKSRFIEPGTFIGAMGTHEAHGWACAGKLSVSGNGTTINPGEITFAALSIDFESSSEGVVWNSNNKQDAQGNSPLCLTDNFGNLIFLVPNFGAGFNTTDAPGTGSTSMSVTVEDK